MYMRGGGERERGRPPNGCLEGRWWTEAWMQKEETASAAVVAAVGMLRWCGCVCGVVVVLWNRRVCFAVVEPFWRCFLFACVFCFVGVGLGWRAAWVVSTQTEGEDRLRALPVILPLDPILARTRRRRASAARGRQRKVTSPRRSWLGLGGPAAMETCHDG